MLILGGLASPFQSLSIYLSTLISILQQNLGLGVRDNGEAEMLLATLLPVSIFQFDVVVAQQIRQDHLHLTTSKVSAGTRPNPMSEIDIVHPGRSMLILQGVPGDQSQLLEPETIEFLRVSPQLWVEIQCMCPDHNPLSAGNDMSAGQFQSFLAGHDSRHVCYHRRGVSTQVQVVGPVY